MTETAQAQQADKPEEKEADHHPYYRPKDAATLILVDNFHATRWPSQINGTVAKMILSLRALPILDHL